jgi:hypothetical protein
MQHVKSTITLAALAIWSLGALAQPKNYPVDVRVVNTPAEAVPVRRPSVTHMGVPVQDHVRLNTGSGGNSTCAAGEAGVLLDPRPVVTSFFTVPAGKALIITNVSYGVRARVGSPWTIGTLVSVDMRINDGTTSSGRAWQSGVVVDAAMAAGQQLWRNESVLAGIVIRAGETVCLIAGLGFEPNGSATFINLSKLYGYLVDAQL